MKSESEGLQGEPGESKRSFAPKVRTIADSLPFRVGSAILIGAWVALAALFTFVGIVLVGTVVTVLGQSLGPVTVLITVFGVFGTPPVSLVLAQRVITTAVERFEPIVAPDDSAIRDSNATPDSEATFDCRESPGDEQFGSCRTNEPVDNRTPQCC